MPLCLSVIHHLPCRNGNSPDFLSESARSYQKVQDLDMGFHTDPGLIALPAHWAAARQQLQLPATYLSD